MHNGRTQDLSEAFASIIKMMLVAIRAQGLRSLKHLPMLIMVALELRRVGKEFAAIMAAFRAGTLPPPHPAPAPWCAPPDEEAACACSSGAPRPTARPDPAAGDRQRLAERPSPPAADAEPDRVRAADGACSAAALPHAGGQAAVRPRPSRRTPDPFAVLGLPAGVIAPGRSC